MSEQIDWSKAPADATHYQSATNGVFECWLKPGHAVRVSRSEPDWREDEHADDLIATSAIKRPWSGEGLPPVGVHVEWYSDVYGWLGGKVIGHDGTVAVVSHNDGYTGCHLHNLKPIRTQEQIAAEEREATIKEIVFLIESADSRDKTIAEAIYDAGYRKQDDK